jgi:hypothetical protein
MNDEELKARLRGMRMPSSDPQADRDSMERAIAAFRSRGQPPAPGIRRTWRDWLWPSPYAWGALAGIWLILCAAGRAGNDASPPEPPVAQWAPSLNPAALTASVDYRDILSQIGQQKPSQ